MFEIFLRANRNDFPAYMSLHKFLIRVILKSYLKMIKYMLFLFF